ncbi:hypothetical protein JCM8547_000139 [Rhodosporidiobolus lusitaniae]
MGLSQEKVGKLFARSDSPEETEELLLAYVFSKWTSGGNAHQVQRKLHLLTLYLRAVNLGPKLKEHYSAFTIVAVLTKEQNTPVIVLPTTPLGLEAWNAARRPSQSVIKRAFLNRSTLDVRSGGLGSGSSENSDAEERERPMTSQGYAPRVSVDTVAEERRGGGFGGFLAGRRSRSGTIVTAVVVQPGTQDAQERRRTAGAGHGLGTGLLSAPPNYNGRDLQSYIEGDPSLLAHGRARSEVDLLPDYA